MEKLTQALNKEELRAEAAEMLRSMIQTIRLVPEEGELAIELVGELAGILALRQEKSPRPFGPVNWPPLVGPRGLGFKV